LEHACTKEVVEGEPTRVKIVKTKQPAEKYTLPSEHPIKPAPVKGKEASQTSSKPFDLTTRSSPTAAADPGIDDFVLFRRKRESAVDEKPEPAAVKPSDSQCQSPKAKPKRRSSRKAAAKKSTVENEEITGNEKWVRFLDVAISCPSDASEDELLFLKPASTIKQSEKQSKRNHRRR